ncbi:Uncharacterised protein [uncultured archaeon]|nr:Uncharacterised protein [uncultured archaeon]
MANNTYQTVWNPTLNTLPQNERGYYKLSQIAAPERQKIGTNSYRPLNVVANTVSPTVGHPWTTQALANVNFSGQETPTGNVNGINATFYLANGTVDISTLTITVDDLLQIQNQDYTISGATYQTIQFIDAPSKKSIIYAFYAYGTPA